MAQRGWLFAKDKCVGCESCTVSCMAENNTSPQGSPVEVEIAGLQFKRVNYRWVVKRESGTYPTVRKTFTSMGCNHCQDPACRASCPVNAISKRASDGIVLIDQDKCIGCSYCIQACPYGGPRFNEATKKVEKCTFCVHRIDAGLLPACATTCVGRALSMEADFSPAQSGEDAPEGFASPKLTIPSIRFEG